jgi:hypothetical protein
MKFDNSIENPFEAAKSKIFNISALCLTLP